VTESTVAFIVADPLFSWFDSARRDGAEKVEDDDIVGGRFDEMVVEAVLDRLGVVILLELKRDVAVIVFGVFICVNIGVESMDEGGVVKVFESSEKSGSGVEVGGGVDTFKDAESTDEGCDNDGTIPEDKDKDEDGTEEKSAGDDKMVEEDDFPSSAIAPVVDLVSSCCCVRPVIVSSQLKDDKDAASRLLEVDTEWRPSKC
jgi:hypothetical protein